MGRNWSYFQKKHKDVEKATISREENIGRFAIVQLKSAEAAVAFCAVVNGPGQEGVMTAVQISDAQKDAIQQYGVAAGLAGPSLGDHQASCSGGIYPRNRSRSHNAGKRVATGPQKS